MGFASLPDELVLRILKYLHPLLELPAVATVSRHFNILCKDQLLWKYFCVQRGWPLAEKQIESARNRNTEETNSPPPAKRRKHFTLTPGTVALPISRQYAQVATDAVVTPDEKEVGYAVSHSIDLEGFYQRFYETSSICPPHHKRTAYDEEKEQNFQTIFRRHYSSLQKYERIATHALAEVMKGVHAFPLPYPDSEIAQNILFQPANKQFPPGTRLDEVTPWRVFAPDDPLLLSYEDNNNNLPNQNNRNSNSNNNNNRNEESSKSGNFFDELHPVHLVEHHFTDYNATLIEYRKRFYHPHNVNLLSTRCTKIMNVPFDDLIKLIMLVEHRLCWDRYLACGRVVKEVLKMQDGAPSDVELPYPFQKVCQQQQDEPEKHNTNLRMQDWQEDKLKERLQNKSMSWIKQQLLAQQQAQSPQRTSRTPELPHQLQLVFSLRHLDIAHLMWEEMGLEFLRGVFVLDTEDSVKHASYLPRTALIVEHAIKDNKGGPGIDIEQDLLRSVGGPYMEITDDGLRQTHVGKAKELLRFSVKGTGWLIQEIDSQRTHVSYVVGVEEESYWNENLLVKNLCLFRSETLESLELYYNTCYKNGIFRRVSLESEK